MSAPHEITPDEFHDQLAEIAYRSGLKPGEWEELQPIELYEYATARAWARSRDLEVIAVAALVIANQIPRWSDESSAPPSLKDILKAFPWYIE